MKMKLRVKENYITKVLKMKRKNCYYLPFYSCYIKFLI